MMLSVNHPRHFRSSDIKDLKLLGRERLHFMDLVFSVGVMDFLKSAKIQSFNSVSTKTF